MAGEIKSSDLFSDDLLTKAQAGFDKLNASLQAQIDLYHKLATAAQVALSKVNFNGSADIKKAAEHTIAIEKASQSLLKTQQEKNKVDATYATYIKNIEMARQQEIRTNNIIEGQNQKAIGTINQLKKANSDLTKERNRLDLQTEVGRKRLVDINKELDKNNAFIKANASSLEKQRMEIGGYADAIREALGANKLFGDSFGELSKKLQGIKQLLASFKSEVGAGKGNKSQGVGIGETTATAGTEAETAATQANTAAKVENSAVTETSIIANEGNAVAINTEAVATEEAAVATGVLSKALNFLKANPVIAIIAGLLAAGAAFVEFKRQTKEGADAIDEFDAGADAGAKALFQLGTNADEAAKAATRLAEAEHRLRDEEIQMIPIYAELERRIASSKLAAEEENITTQDRIELLSDVIDNEKMLFEFKKKAAIQDFANKAGIEDTTEALKKLKEASESTGKITEKTLKEAFNLEIKPERLKEVMESGAKVLQVESEGYLSLKRVTKQRTNAIRADRDAIRKMQSDANKEELEAIRIVEDEKIHIINQTLAKQKKIETQRYEEEVRALALQQSKLGATIEGKDRSEKFGKEIEAKYKLHLSKLAELDTKASDDKKTALAEYATRENERLKKIEEQENKYNDDHAKAITEAIANDHDRALSQIKEEELIARRKAEIEANESIESGSDPFKAEELKQAKILAIDSDYDQKRAQLEKDTADKHASLVNKTASDYAQGLKDSETVYKMSLEEKGIKGEKLEKKMRDKRIEDLKLEIANRHDLGLAAVDQEAQLTQEIADKKKKAHEEEMDQIKQTIDFVEQSLKRKDDLTKQQLQNDLEMRQRNILQQEQLASQGMNNTLAFEKAAAAKDELQKQELAKKEEKREKAIAFLKLFAAYADKGEPDQALAKTLVQMAIAGAITGAYAEGVENLDGPGTATSDSIVARLSKGESVTTAKATSENPGLATAMNKGSVDEYFEKIYLPKYITNTDAGFAENVMNSILVREVASLKDEMRAVKKAIEEKPVSITNLNNLGQVIEDKVRKGYTVRTKRGPSNSPLNMV